MPEPISASEIMGDSVIRELVYPEISAGKKRDRFNESSVYVYFISLILQNFVGITNYRYNLK